jgi:signal transduction histidine kinase
VSGGIMVYLSIQNSSNFRELTDKRILEEEKEIHKAYRSTFQESIQQLTKDLELIIAENKLSGDSELPKPINDFVSDYLIMEKNGALIRPHYSVQHYSPPLRPTGSLFSTLFVQGERLEFSDNELLSSQNSYLAALQKASKSSDSAMVYNALSRLQLKQNNLEKAIDYFEIIITDFGNSLNSFGIPYPYFSIDLLMKQKGEKLKTQKIDLFQKFLVNLNLGKIPFTPSTPPLLDSLQGYLAQEIDSVNLDLFTKHLKNATRSAYLISNYRPLLYDLVNKNEDIIGDTNMNNFKIFPSQEFHAEILLTADFEGYTYGFIVPLSSLDNYVQTKLIGIKNSFDYSPELRAKSSLSQQSISKYDYQDSFSTIFPHHNLRISIKDKASVSSYIFIGLCLLLAAMIIGFFMLVQDVNRKKRMEKLRANFIANVTHELKTPLTSINMFADTILMGRAENEKTLMKYARIIVKESEKLKRMINNILEFSRQENQKLNFELKEENLSAVILDIMDEMNYWLEINKFEVSLSLDEHLTANIDGEGLKQVLSNLITNAIKYSEEKKKIEIRLYQQNQKAIIEVEDHGIGIAEHQLSRIFEKFYRVNSSQTGNISGTGLGLKVSKDIIEAQNGSLTVTSTVNKGSTFTIQLTSITSAS